MLLLLDVAVIDGWIHRSSVQLPLVGTARWISTAQLGVASSRTGQVPGPLGGHGQGCPGMLPVELLPSAGHRALLVLSWSTPKTTSPVKGTAGDHTPMPDRHFSTLRGTSLHFN